MKQMNRALCAVLIVALLCSLASFASAEEEVSVYIPDKVERLQLPESEDEFEGDPFRTGMEGAKAFIYRETVKVITDCGTTNVTYVAKVVADYPEGNTIRRVTAEYANNKKKTLTKYTIRYQTGPKEFYTISYAPRTNTVAEDHYEGEITYVDHGVQTFRNQDTGDSYTVNLDANLPSATLFRDSAGAVYLHRYEQDEILEGVYTDGNVTLKNGVGKYFGQNAWFQWQGGSATRYYKAGLRALVSFVSPRVQ